MPAESGEKKLEHTLRPADHTVTPLTLEEKRYWGRIANRTTQILKQKVREGKLKPQRSGRRGHVNKVAIVMVLLVITFSTAIAWAQWQGQISAQTTIRAPLYVPNPQVTVGDIWLNTSRSIIISDFFTVNTAGKTIFYQFGAYATIQFSNGTTTPDMSKVFLQLSLIISDGAQNMTVVSLLTPEQPVQFPPFQYVINGDRPFRLIINYITKNVSLGSTSASLVINSLYSYSGQ